MPTNKGHGFGEPRRKPRFERSLSSRQLKRLNPNGGPKRVWNKLLFPSMHDRLNHEMIGGIKQLFQKHQVPKTHQRKIMGLEQKATTFYLLRKRAVQKLKNRVIRRESPNMRMMIIIGRTLLENADEYLKRNNSKKGSLWRYVAEFREIYDPRYKNHLKFSWERENPERKAIEVTGDHGKIEYFFYAAQAVLEDCIKNRVGENPEYYKGIRRLRRELLRTFEESIHETN